MGTRLPQPSPCEMPPRDGPFTGCGHASRGAARRVAAALRAASVGRVVAEKRSTVAPTTGPICARSLTYSPVRLHDDVSVDLRVQPDLDVAAHRADGAPDMRIPDGDLTVDIGEAARDVRATRGAPLIVLTAPATGSSSLTSTEPLMQDAEPAVTLRARPMSPLTVLPLPMVAGFAALMNRRGRGIAGVVARLHVDRAGVPPDPRAVRWAGGERAEGEREQSIHGGPAGGAVRTRSLRLSRCGMQPRDGSFI
jgi:hypothetical protein